MTKTEYREYISSTGWQMRRRQYLEIHNACAVCEMPRWLTEIVYDQDLNIHHVSYANLGHELDTDLLALCLAR